MGVAWRWAREGGVTAAAFVVCLVGGLVRADGALTAPPVGAYVVAVLSCAVLPVRSRVPLVAMVVTTAGGVLAVPLGLLLSPLVVAPAVVAAYSYALSERFERRTAAVVVAAAAALLAASAPVFGELSWQDAGRVGAVPAFPLVAALLGNAVRNRRAYLAAVEERARRAEQERDGEARRRVAEERVRIARELHDLVAHRITLANAQATVAAHFFDARPEQARKSLGELVETTGQALDELRATVGLLRQTGDATAPVEPAPGLAQVPALLDTFRRAGLEVSVHHEGTVRPLPAAVDLTAYRIVQEALTNVTRHAETGTARVRLAWSRDRVRVTIADDGRGARTGSEPPPGYGRGARTGSGRPPGYGLIGMRERAVAVGGSLAAGARPEGGFLVTAELPFPTPREAAREEAARDEAAGKEAAP